ncbi:prion-inhibition and propagation-domain-containing protein [Clohesyomyces aquaticus]|uniref:Prion-inhibition and propagation-domain-containing protein n=1 Tax=Clohesyomyces aquaticus TaxID=1231657 RepID=A0A1Y1ZP37_9PLEO|nr:prion-inhibition and propagation-domain-containing protein [Clohesyomyces aquaticus]
MEVGGIVLGAVSLLAGFKGAVDGLQLLSDIYHSFEDASFYGVKFEVEKQRLQIWGEFFGFNDHAKCEKLRAQPEVAQSLVLYILMEFQDASTNLDIMIAKYGLKLVDTNMKTTPNAHTKLQPKSELLDKLADAQRKSDSKLKWWKKGMPWTLDLAKFEKLLDRLEYLNDSLERIVPRVDLALLTQGLASYLVPNPNTSYLDAFKNSSQQYVAMCAAAKQVKLTSTIMSEVPMVPWSSISSVYVAETLSDGSTRVLAVHQDSSTGFAQKIIIDWKEPNSNLSVSERDEVLTRIKGMCLLFQEISQNGSDHFRVLPCLGLIEDPEYARQHTGHKKHGFVFAYPNQDANRPESLYQGFASLGNVPIGTRFRLAQNLASGILLLHSSKWLHKNICSQNVLFFHPKRVSHPASTEHVASGYLTGFSYSRPDSPNQVSLERPQTKGSFDFYRHPDYEKGHSRLNDIYSLGVVLFEIGHWKSIRTVYDQMKLSYTKEAEIKSFLVDNCTALAARMGEIYASVVKRCLTSDFGGSPISNDEGELVRAFWSLVVRELDSCRA